MKAPRKATLKQCEDAIRTPVDECYELTLFVSGASDLSARAITSARKICDTHLSGRHHLSVIDLQEDSAAPFAGLVLVAPTLVRSRPLPVRKLVGDLSDTDKVLQVFGLPITTPAPDALG